MAKRLGGFDRAIIADHGWPAAQQFKDRVLRGNSEEMRVISTGLKTGGTLGLGGCSTMWGAESLQYAYELQRGSAINKKLTIVGYTSDTMLSTHSIAMPGSEIRIPFDGSSNLTIKTVPKPPPPMPLPPTTPPPPSMPLP